MADVARRDPRAADHHVPPRRDRRARAEGDRAQPPGADRARRLDAVRGFFVVFKPLIWLLQRATDRSSSGSDSSRPAPSTTAHSEAELRMLLSSSAEQGEIEHGEQEMLDKVFDFADKDVADVMVPRPDVVALSVDLAAGGGARGRARLAVHALPGLPRVARRDRRHPPRPRPRSARSTSAGSRRRRSRIAAAPATMVPETQGPRRASDRVPAHEPAHRDRVRRVRGRWRGSSRSRTCSRRSSARSRTSSTSPEETVEQIDEDTVRIDGMFTIDDFNEQFDVELPDEDYHTVGGFVFGRSAGRRAGRRGRLRRDAFPRRRGRGPAHRADTVTFEERPRRRDPADALLDDDDEVQ